MSEKCICGAEGPPFRHAENCTDLWARAPSPSRDQGTSDAQIAEWERLALSTPRGWRVDTDCEGEERDVVATCPDGETQVVIAECFTDDEARFIAAARTAVPALIALVRAERSRATEAERERDEWSERHRAQRATIVASQDRAAAAERRAEAAEAALRRLLRSVQTYIGRDAEGAIPEPVTPLEEDLSDACGEAATTLAAASPSRKGDATHG